MTAKPIDLVYDIETDSYDLSRFSSDEDLLDQVQKGMTEYTVFQNYDDIIKVDQVFGGTQPEILYQNPITGMSNIQSATAALYHFHAWVDQEKEQEYDDDGEIKYN